MGPEHSEYLKYARFGEPDRILSRGHAHGVSQRTERLIRTSGSRRPYRGRAIFIQNSRWPQPPVGTR